MNYNHQFQLITRPGRLEALRVQLRTDLADVPYAMAQAEGPLPDTVVLWVNVTSDRADDLVLAAAARHGAVVECPRRAS